MFSHKPKIFLSFLKRFQVKPKNGFEKKQKSLLILKKGQEKCCPFLKTNSYFLI